MRTTLQQAVAAALFAGAAAIATAQAPGPTIPNTTHPTSGANPQASSEVQRNHVEEPVASVASGIPAERVQAAQGLVEALNADASLKGSKLTVVPEENGVLITGVTPSLRQMAQVVNTATQQSGGTDVKHAISTEEVVIDVGTSAANPDAMIPADQIAGDEGQQAEQGEKAAQPSEQQPAAQQPSAEQQPAAQAQQGATR